MFGGQTSIISSYLDWWAQAGVIDAVGDESTNWLAPVTKAAPAALGPTVQLNEVGVPVAERHLPADVPARPATTAPRQSPAPVAIGALPDDLASFDAWLADHPALPGGQWNGPRILPQGPCDAPLMVLADAPDADDLSAGHLLCGAAGRLFDAMMAAIGHSRADIRLASIAFTRPPAGRIEGPDSDQLLAIARHHIMLARPRHVLLMGQQSCTLLTGDVVPADGRGQRQINHSGANTAVSAIHHPRLLLKQPLLKRSAWTALKRLKELKLT